MDNVKGKDLYPMNHAIKCLYTNEESIAFASYKRTGIEVRHLTY